jgi:hypothetical protein
MAHHANDAANHAGSSCLSRYKGKENVISLNMSFIIWYRVETLNINEFGVCGVPLMICLYLQVAHCPR